MVDSLGGVTVNNPTAIVNCPYEAGQTVSFRRGDVTLNGDAGARPSRGCASATRDFSRALRQQAVVSGLKSKVLSLGSLYAAPWRGANVVRTLTTDIGTIDLVKMGWLQARLSQKPGDRMVLPGDDQTIGGISYVIGVPDADEATIRRFVATK